MTAPRRTYLPAFAKINLTLEVLGKRDDGYHNLASVMQTVALHDTLCFCPNSTNTITCTCDIVELAMPDNLALRAAQLLATKASHPPGGLLIELQKGIPFQAGLGGGSSDAAAVLVALNHLWHLNIPPERLEVLGAQLGSDVPFFVRGGTALIEGRGERVTQLPDAEPIWLILVKPDIGISTPDVFRALQPEIYGTGEHTSAVVTAIRQRAPLPAEHLVNSLEDGVLRAYPEVSDLRDRLLRLGAPFVRMSGSGPTLYAPFRDLQAASSVFRQLQSSGIQGWLTHTIPSGTVRRAQTGVAGSEGGG